MNSDKPKPILTNIEKKSYIPPKLVVYGSLRDLTKMFAMGKGGKKGDAMGAPATRL